MERQLNIRSDEAHEIVEHLTASTRESRRAIIDAALRHYAAHLASTGKPRAPDWTDVFGYGRALAAALRGGGEGR